MLNLYYCVAAASEEVTALGWWGTGGADVTVNTLAIRGLMVRAIAMGFAMIALWASVVGLYFVRGMGLVGLEAIPPFLASKWCPIAFGFGFGVPLLQEVIVWLWSKFAPRSN